MAKLHSRSEKELAVWERHIDRLERRAGSRFAPTADGKPCPLYLTSLS